MSTQTDSSKPEPDTTVNSETSQEPTNKTEQVNPEINAPMTEKSDFIRSKSFSNVKKSTVESLRQLAKQMEKRESEILDLAVENLLTPKADSIHKFDPACENCQNDLLNLGYVVIDGPTWEKVRHHV